MCYISFLNSLFFTTTFSMFTVNPPSRIQYYNYSSEVNAIRNFSRNQRQGQILHTAVCSDLDKVEDSPFIAMILLRESGRLQCMGSIIDEYHVLTAKPCFQGIDVVSLKVVAGYASPYFGKNSQVRFVDKITKHPMMNLVILLLLKPFTFTKTVKPILVIGPEKMTNDFSGTYNKFKPLMVAGIALPSKHSPHRGNLIPRGFIYQLKSSSYYAVPTPCNEKMTEGGVPIRPLNKDYNFCTDGKTQFCWTAVGSPTVGVFEKIIVQIGVVTFAKCRYIRPTPKPETPPTPPVRDYGPYEHVRLDWFWHWVKANSFIKDELRVQKRVNPGR